MMYYRHTPLATFYIKKLLISTNLLLELYHSIMQQTESSRSQVNIMRYQRTAFLFYCIDLCLHITLY